MPLTAPVALHGSGKAGEQPLSVALNDVCVGGQQRLTFATIGDNRIHSRRQLDMGRKSGPALPDDPGITGRRNYRMLHRAPLHMNSLEKPGAKALIQLFQTSSPLPVLQEFLC